MGFRVRVCTEGGHPHPSLPPSRGGRGMGPRMREDTGQKGRGRAIWPAPFGVSFRLPG